MGSSCRGAAARPVAATLGEPAPGRPRPGVGPVDAATARRWGRLAVRGVTGRAHRPERAEHPGHHAGRCPSSTNDGSRHRPSGRAALTPTARARSSTVASRVLGERRRPAARRHVTTGAPVDRGRSSARPSGARAGSPASACPDRRRVHAEPQPRDDRGQAVARRSRERVRRRAPPPRPATDRHAARPPAARRGAAGRAAPPRADAHRRRLSLPTISPDASRRRRTAGPGQRRGRGTSRPRAPASSGPQRAPASHPALVPRLTRGPAPRDQDREVPGGQTRGPRASAQADGDHEGGHVRSSTSRAIASIHHSPARPMPVPRRQARPSPGGVTRAGRRAGRRRRPSPWPRPARAARPPARAVARAEASSPSTTRRVRRAATRSTATRSTAAAEALAGAVGDLPGGRRAAGGRRRPGCRAASPRAPRDVRADAEGRGDRAPATDQDAATWSRAAPEGWPGGSSAASCSHASRTRSATDLLLTPSAPSLPQRPSPPSPRPAATATGTTRSRPAASRTDRRRRRARHDGRAASRAPGAARSSAGAVADEHGGAPGPAAAITPVRPGQPERRGARAHRDLRAGSPSAARGHRRRHGDQAGVVPARGRRSPPADALRRGRGAGGPPRRRRTRAGCARPARSRPAASARASIRAGTSAAELACSVPQPPSCPVFRAASRSTTSPPRTSPTTRRSGRIRSAWRTRVRRSIGARALDVGGTRLEADDVRVLGTQLGGVLDQHDPLAPGRPATAGEESSVVLPEPVPPLTRNASAGRDQARAAGRRRRGTRPGRDQLGRG